MSDQPMYLIPKSLKDAIERYLETRPYKEVGQAMPSLAQLKLFNPESQEKPKTQLLKSGGNPNG